MTDMLLEHDAFADDQWIVSLTDYVRELVHSHKKPVVGVCFGHQILARALGARVGRSDGWEISVEEIDLTDAGKKLFGQDKLVSITFLAPPRMHQLTSDSTSTKCTAMWSSRCPRAAPTSAPALAVPSRVCICHPA